MQSRDVHKMSSFSQSSFQTSPAFWLDPKNGVEYSVAVQEPQYRVDSYQALQTLRSTEILQGAALNSGILCKCAQRRARRISQYTTQR